MADRIQISDLVERWRTLRTQGQPAAAELLCADCPDLLEEVRRRIRELEALDTVPPAAAKADPYATVGPATKPSAGGTIPLGPADGAAPLGRVAGYALLAELGRGGMGVVYLARQDRPGRLVALKMILAGAHASPQELERFHDEAQAIARLQHPNIVQVHEVGERDGLPFFSLEFCPGGSLARKLGGTPLPAKEAASLVETLARAMHAAHQKGIVHRDLKPANILLMEDGTPKVTDFGLAKVLGEQGHTATGDVMGTPSYMAPEQAGGKAKELGPACDVYALGAILYECLTGRPPFRAATSLETVWQVLHEEPVPPSQLNARLPRDLGTVCLKCLQKDPARRYPSAEALAEDLRRFQAGEPVVARPVGRLERAGKWARRNPGVAAALAGVALALLLGTAVSMYFAIDAAAQAEQALKNEGKAKDNEAKAKENEARAIAARGELEKANQALKHSRDDLERTLARSLLRPLGLQGIGIPLTDGEVVALWELGDQPSEDLGYRFLEEALTHPVTLRQLVVRADFSLQAFVRLSPSKRSRVERLLFERLQGAVPGEQRGEDISLLLAALGGLTPQALGLVGTTLTQYTAKTRDPVSLASLGAVAAWLPAKQAADLLANAMGRLANAVGTTYGDLYALASLARGLAEVAARLPADQAQRRCAEAADLLTAAMGKYVHWDALASLARGLAAVAAQLPADQGQRRCAEAADLLTAAVGKTTHPLTLDDLAQGLAAVAARLPADQAQRHCAEAADLLTAAMGKTADPYHLAILARGLAAVAARLPPEAAQRRCAEAASLLIGAMAKLGNMANQQFHANTLADLAGRLPDGQAVERSRAVTTAAAMLAGPGQPLFPLVPLWQACEPLPRQLPPQVLVDLLKHPLCVGQARRVLLDQLERHYHRPFADQWEFVHFAQQQHPELDLTSPPVRPALAAGGAKS